MPKHEFGIMPSAPNKGVRYDGYEPYKYACISIEDCYLENIVSALERIELYWHTIDVRGKGLAYYGITLIPPESMLDFISVIKNINELFELKSLMQKAYNEHKWIIHYGL